MREKELLAACGILKARIRIRGACCIPISRLMTPCAQISPENVRIVNNPKLQDGMKTDWPADDVASEVHKAMKLFKPTQVRL